MVDHDEQFGVTRVSLATLKKVHLQKLAGWVQLDRFQREIDLDAEFSISVKNDNETLN